MPSRSFHRGKKCRQEASIEDFFLINNHFSEVLDKKMPFQQPPDGQEEKSSFRRVLKKGMFHRFWISGGSKNAVRAVSWESSGAKTARLFASGSSNQPIQHRSTCQNLLAMRCPPKSSYSPRIFQRGSCCTHQQRSLCLSRGENMFLAHSFATNNSNVSQCGVEQVHTSGTQNTLEWHHTSCDVLLCLLVIPAVLRGLFFFLIVLLGRSLLNPHLYPRPLGNLSATVRFLQFLTAASEAVLPHCVHFLFCTGRLFVHSSCRFVQQQQGFRNLFQLPAMVEPWRPEALNGPLTTGNRPCADGLLHLVRPSIPFPLSVFWTTSCTPQLVGLPRFCRWQGVHSFQWWERPCFCRPRLLPPGLVRHSCGTLLAGALESEKTYLSPATLGFLKQSDKHLPRDRAVREGMLSQCPTIEQTKFCFTSKLPTKL